MANPSESLNWFMLNYVDKSKLQVKSSGDGGLAELAGKFEDDQVMFGFLKVGAEDRKAVTSVRNVGWISLCGCCCCKITSDTDCLHFIAAITLLLRWYDLDSTKTLHDYLDWGRCWNYEKG